MQVDHRRAVLRYVTTDVAASILEPFRVEVWVSCLTTIRSVVHVRVEHTSPRKGGLVHRPVVLLRTW
jgi:hypothetical protein